MISKILGFKTHFPNNTGKLTKTAIVMSSIAISIIFVAGLASFPLTEKAMANPCSDISSSGGPGGPGGNGGPGGSGTGIGIFGPGFGFGGPGGNGGPGGQGGNGQTDVECTFGDVQITEPLG